MGLREGTIKAVVATNALELGIDIGGLGAAILVGYPGTVASAKQQAGRAGRGLESAAAVLVTSASPLDQFLAHHPEYFFERSPEQALVNPDHLLILLEHLRCAMFELPFRKGEAFGSLPGEVIDEYLQLVFAANPIEATQLGIHDYDSTLGDFSAEAYTEEIAKRQEQERRRFEASPLFA